MLQRQSERSRALFRVLVWLTAAQSGYITSPSDFGQSLRVGTTWYRTSGTSASSAAFNSSWFFTTMLRPQSRRSTPETVNFFISSLPPFVSSPTNVYIRCARYTMSEMGSNQSTHQTVPKKCLILSLYVVMLVCTTVVQTSNASVQGNRLIMKPGGVWL